MDEKDPIAFAELEIIEAAEVKPSDLNGWLTQIKHSIKIFLNAKN